MAEIRQRKPAAAAAASSQQQAPASSTARARGTAAPTKEPAGSLLLGVSFVLFTLIFGGALFYHVDNTNQGDFARVVNDFFPQVPVFFAQFPPVPFLANAQETSPGLRLTEAELRAFDGTDPDKPIYLAIDGTIFDVSVSPKFYGPQGMYGHFAGRDASRAWVTECWDEEDQLTWRMDGLEDMYTPKYFDEQLEAILAGGEVAPENIPPILSGLPREQVVEMARKALAKFGSVTDSEKAQRRSADAPAAQAQVKEKLDHWYGFFETSPKYSVAGKLIRDEDKPAPPPLCEKSLRKKPFHGGKLEHLLAAASKPDTGKDEL